LDDDLKIPELDLQPRSRIRILSRQLTVLEKNMLRDRFNETFEPNRLDWLDDINPHRQEVTLDSSATKIENLDDLGVQEKLLIQFLKQYELDEDTVQKIFEINRRYNAHIRKEEDTLRNVLYRIGKVKWSNTFSYAENNEIDFPEHKGLLGVFGKSGVGKSSAVVDVPLYCMFNKISKRVTKNDWIINENKEECSAEMEIFLRDKMYKIKRKTGTFLKSGKKSGKPVYQGRTDVDFRVFGADGSEEELNAEERRTTDVEIRKLFGTPEDFVATSVAPQWKLLNLVEAGGTDRQNLIGRYFDIDIFDQKHKLAKDELRETNAKLKGFGDGNLKADLEKSEKLLKEIKSKVIENESVKNLQKRNKEKLDEHIQELRDAVVPISADYNLKEEEIDNDIQVVQESFDEKKREVEELELEIASTEDEMDNLKAEFESFDIDDLKETKEIYDAITEEIKEGKDKLYRTQSELKKEAETLAGYKNMPCIKNSNCGMKSEIKKLEASVSILQDTVKQIEQYLVSKCSEANKLAIDTVKIKLDRSVEIEQKMKSIDSLDRVRDKLDDAREWFDFYEKDLEKKKKVSESFQKNKEQVQKNIEIKKKIKVLQLKKRLAGELLDEAIEEAIKLSREFGAISGQHEAKKASVDEYEALKVDYEAYDYFMRAMSKDGIVRQIIANNLGIINSEIEKILSHGVGFTVTLESNEDGKAIDIFFKHERSPKRHIELCSGMEKTMAEVAIRAALVNITTLPRSNIFVLDESFGALDPEYMAGLTRILEYLKTLFETVVIITHKDELRDFVDHVIEVERDESGYARLT
jgi:DNA repair exonuclease SbcCD ATPase subunit